MGLRTCLAACRDSIEPMFLDYCLNPLGEGGSEPLVDRQGFL